MAEFAVHQHLHEPAEERPQFGHDIHPTSPGTGPAWASFRLGSKATVIFNRPESLRALALAAWKAAGQLEAQIRADERAARELAESADTVVLPELVAAAALQGGPDDASPTTA